MQQTTKVCSTKKCSTRYDVETRVECSKKKGGKTYQSGYSFEDLFKTKTMVKTDFDLDTRFESSGFLKFQHRFLKGWHHLLEKLAVKLENPAGKEVRYDFRPIKLVRDVLVL